MSQLALFGGAPVRTRTFPSWPVFDDNEERNVLEVLRSGNWWRYSCGEGSSDTARCTTDSKVAAFQRAFADFQGARFGIACTNGTAALEIVLKAAGIGPGDEVIVPPYSFVATATAPLAVNAVPIFCDVEPGTFNLDPDRLEEAITERTRAIIPVHFAGLSADMERILAVARTHRLFVLEDAAHAHGATWNGKGLGTLGNAGTFSFQNSKNMTAGEGGLILTNDRELATRCESYIWGGRELGRPWYEHHRLGGNYRMTEFQGAILLAQLSRLEAQTAKRMENGTYLTRQLARIPGIHPPQVPNYATRPSFHIYGFRFDQAEFGAAREQLLAALVREGVPCSSGYAHPLYRNPLFLNQDFHPGGCPVTCHRHNRPLDYAAFAALCPNAERACQEAVWLEHRLLLGDTSDMDDIVEAIAKVYDCRDELRTVQV